MFAEKFDSYEEVQIDIDENGRISVFDITRALHYVKHMLLAANSDSFEPFTLGLAFERHDDKLARLVEHDESIQDIYASLNTLKAQIAYLKSGSSEEEEIPF